MSKRSEAGGKPPEPDFEAALGQLESLVERLEGQDLPLEEALATFEAGVELTRRCSEQLEAAERRIEVLVREGGRLVARPHETEDAPPDEGD
jgi:exodeoxyribonuclease VII small subunit